MTADNPTTTGLARGTQRPFAIPPCSLTAGDLRKLYQLLEGKAQEAAQLQLASLQRQPRQTEEEFEDCRRKLEAALALVVVVVGTNGEYVAAQSIEAVTDDSLPDSILTIAFESAYLCRREPAKGSVLDIPNGGPDPLPRARATAKADPRASPTKVEQKRDPGPPLVGYNGLNQQPLNWFSVTLSFARTEIMDMTVRPSANESAVVVNGTNLTWVNGVFQELQTFFEERRLRARGWLYGRYTYEVLMLFLGLPLSFEFAFGVDKLARPVLHLPDALFVALYVHLVLVALLGFRLLFNYARWVFPCMEGPSCRQGWPKVHKAIWTFMATVLIGLIVEILLRLAGVPAL